MEIMNIKVEINKNEKQQNNSMNETHSCIFEKKNAMKLIYL